jgi:hypothetical protein
LFSFLSKDVVIPVEIEYDGAKMAVLIDIEGPRLQAEKTIFEGTWAGEIKSIVVKKETWSRHGEGSQAEWEVEQEAGLCPFFPKVVYTVAVSMSKERWLSIMAPDCAYGGRRRMTMTTCLNEALTYSLARSVSSVTPNVLAAVHW